MIIEGSHKATGTGIFVSDIQERSAAFHVSVFSLYVFVFVSVFVFVFVQIYLLTLAMCAKTILELLNM